MQILRTAPRLTATALLLGIHGLLLGVGEALPDAVAAVLGGTIFLTLQGLDLLGLPVLTGAESGGWSGPNLFGWVLIAAIWGLIWWTVVVVFAKLFALLARA